MSYSSDGNGNGKDKVMSDGMVILGVVGIVGLVAVITVSLVYNRPLWLRGTRKSV